jgi:hypothetical protein
MCTIRANSTLHCDGKFPTLPEIKPSPLNQPSIILWYNAVDAQSKGFNLKVEVHDAPKYSYPSTRLHDVNPEDRNIEFFQRFENLRRMQAVAFTTTYTQINFKNYRNNRLTSS